MANENITLRDVMDSYKVYIPHIEEHGVTGALIEQLIKEHEPVKEQLLKSKERYEVSKEGVPILNRKLSHIDTTGDVQRLDTMVNNKLNNTYDSDLVDTLNGYFLGNPINYVVEKTKVKNAERLIEVIDQMRVRDNVPDKDATFGKRASIGGYSTRLCYIAIDADKPVVRIANLRPNECVLIYNESMSEPRYALHYYNDVIIHSDGTKENVLKADFYDELTFTRFIKTDSDFVAEAPILHGFSCTPLFGLEHNDELSSEAQKVLNLIDAYDRTLSDASNEIEATRLAILLLYNLGMDKEEIQKMKSAGVLEMWGEHVDAKYLTKDLNDQMIENHLNRLDKNIMRFGKSIDFTDEQFASNLSGIAILFKTMSLEHKSITCENKMRSSLQYQLKVMCSAWAKLGICQPEDYLNIWTAFKRNLPHNVLESAQATALFKGNISERTRLSLLPFIDDPEAELLAMQQDIKEFGNHLEPLNDIDETPKKVPGEDNTDNDIIDE